MDLDAILPLRTTGEYSNPGDEVSPLPEVYGNYLSPDVGPADSVDVATPAVLIDRLNLVYCVNATRTATTPPVVMWNGVIQDPRTYAWNPANNYEGRGIIATLTFGLRAAGAGVVSVRHGGAVDGAGTPITNPLVGLYDMFTRRAGWTLADFDFGVSQVSRYDMDALGYPFYWCFSEPDKTIRDWLLELMPHYHTDFTESGNGQLAFLLDRSLTTFTLQPDYHVPAYEIEDNGSPATALTFTAHADDVANQVTLHGRHNWVTNEDTASYTWNYVQSQSAYGAAYPIDFTFRAMYTLAHATQWLQSFAMRHGFEPRTVSFTMRGLKGIPLISPRFITVEWPPLGWVQHLLKIRKTSISFGGRRVRLECIDCQRELTDVIDSPLATPTQRRQQFSRLYTYVPGTVGNAGNLADAPSDPRNEAANGDCELGDNGQWDLRTANAAPQWEFVLNANEAHGGRYYLRSLPNTGNGTALTLRHRIDPGQWVLASAWFRQHSIGTNGTAHSAIFFYDQNDAFLNQWVYGNYIDPTSTYFESVAFGQAPAGSYYYRPGIGFEVYPTTGQWRADSLYAISGSQNEVVTTRQGNLVSRNPIINGDFELGGLLYNTSRNWFITNNPGVAAHSGLWYCAHRAEVSSPGEDRLYSNTRMIVTQGQTFTFQVFGRTVNNPTGTARLGVSWVDGQGNFFAENATPGASGPLVNWTLASGSMTVPAGALSAYVWVGVTGHVGGTGVDFWLLDDLFVF